MQDGPVGRALLREYGHRLVPGRVERRSGVVTACEAETGEHVLGLVPDRLQPLDDRRGIGLRVFQGAFQVVQHGQPLGGRPRAFVGPHPLDIPDDAFTKVVQVCQSTPPAVLQVGDLCLELLDPRLELCRVRRGALVRSSPLVRRGALVRDGAFVALGSLPFGWLIHWS